MTEEMIDVNLRLDKGTIAALNKMTKKELINKICVTALECKIAESNAEAFGLRCTVAIEDLDRAQRELDKVQAKLDKAETYVEQARAMIESVMERWYHYDD